MAYIRQNIYRSIPVGYVNDVDQLDQGDYLKCGEVSSTGFLGVNLLTPCKWKDSSGLETAAPGLLNYSVPFFAAAYGCNEARDRDFSEVTLPFGD